MLSIQPFWLILEKKVRGLAKWFEIDLEIKLFGMTVVKWHFPPEVTGEVPTVSNVEKI